MINEEKNQDNLAWVGWWRGRKLVIVIIILMIGGAGWFYVSSKEQVEEVVEEELLPQVKVKRYGEMVGEETITKLATIEPAQSASLIARTGGRVTGLNYQLGEDVKPGQVIIEIDGKGSANPARAQASSAAASLRVFGAIEQQALRAGDQAVAIAQLAVEAAQSGKKLTTEQVNKAREQADLAVKQAEFSLNDLRDSSNRNEILIRSADLGLQAAGLAQDQATIARQTASRQTSDGLKQAEAGLVGAKLAREKMAVDLRGQRVGLEGQVAAANEQVMLAQVFSPLSGQINQLLVVEGDYVRPGQEVGQVIAFNGAKVKIDVATGVRDLLSIGQQLDISSNGQDFTGEVTRLASAPSATTSLWQVDILIKATPEVIHPGDLAEVHLPIGLDQNSKTHFIPLDAVIVRQNGVVLFTADEEGLVQEQTMEVVGYTAGFVEGIVKIDDDAWVVVGGGRLLQAGDRVKTE